MPKPLSNVRQFSPDVYRVRLNIFSIVYFKTVIVEEPHLSAGCGDRQNLIVRAVSDQPVAMIYFRIQFPKERFGMSSIH